MKRKLLLATCFVASAVGMKAQTDVTATYLTNADFSSGTPIDNNVCTYGKDMEGNSTTYYGAQAIEGWTNASVGATADGYDNCALAGAMFVYGGTPWLAGSGNPAPATDPEGNAGNAAGLCAVWGGSIQYTQDVTFPAGSYTIRFRVYNTTSGSGNSSGVITTDLFGFVENGGTTHYAPNNTFAIGQWSTIAVTFTLTEETAGKISMGYVGPGGGGAMPHLFVDNVKILANGMAEDCTNKVNKSGWTGASDGYQGGTINTARQYGDKSIGRHIYQTVSGLDNGTYEVALYSISQKEWNGSLANDAGDVAYVFAEGAYELKEWINARSRAAYPGDENLGIYTISDVKVTDGKLTLGMGLAQANLTEWHHVQIKSLIKTNNPDLSDFITAWENALEAAKAFDQTQTMSATWKAALNTAISTYDDGQVDENDQDALETATTALKEALAKAESSVASYAIIAAGTIPDNSIDGWVCENPQGIHVNTWSVEGNSDGSNMKTPFIENWVSKGNLLGAGKVYYQLAGLEPGEVYYAQALVRSYNEANADAPNGPNFFINNVVTSLSEAGTTFTYNNMSGIYATLGGAATVGEDGILKLGVEIAEDRNYNWVAFKSVSIQSMDDAFDAAVAKVTALEGTIPTAAYNAAYAVVTTYQENYPTTAEGFETAIAAIEAAATTASACIEPYAAYIALDAKADILVAIATDNETANGTLATAISTAATDIDGASTTDEIATVTSTLKTAMVTYIGAANPVGDDAQFDCTFMLTNPDLTGYSWTKVDGWYTDQTFGSQNCQAMYTEGEGYYYEYWSDASCATSDYTVYLKATLPEGTYQMTAKAKAGWGGGASNPDGPQAITFSAGETDGTNITSSTLADAQLDFVQAAEGEVKIGLKAHEGNSCNWMGIGYVKLYKVPANTVEIDEDVDYTPESVAGTVTLKRTLSTEKWNTFVVPFQITNDELKAAFGEDVAVAEFSDEGESADAVTVSFTKMTTPAITPNKPVLLKPSAVAVSDTYEFVNRTVAAGTPKAAGTYVDFVGTYAASTIAEGDYFIANDMLYKSAGATTIKGTRAYLTAHVAGAKIRMVIDDEATGIEGIAADAVQNGKVYDLSGRLVKNPTKGLYIMNGKKYFVK